MTMKQLAEIIDNFALEVESYADDRIEELDDSACGDYPIHEVMALEDLRNRARNIRTEVLEEI